ncbi:MAG: prolyl oligopeptidase family serine peptidase [Planctomycetota bacterium]
MRQPMVPLSLAASLLGLAPLAAQSHEPLDYPHARRVGAADTYHGVEVRDPYRWLEEVDSEEVQRWTRLQDELTTRAVERFGGRPELAARLAAVAAFPNLGAPTFAGGRVFTVERRTDEHTAALRVRDAGADAERVLVDPNPLSEDGSVRLAGPSVAPDGSRVAYAIVRGAERWLTLRIAEVESGATLADQLVDLRSATVAWCADGTSFFYVRYDPPTAPGAAPENPRLARHVVGTDQSHDQVVYAPEDPRDWLLGGVRVSPDGRLLTFEGSRQATPENAFFVAELAPDGTAGDVRELVPEGVAEVHYEANVGPTLYLRTTLDAPRGRLVAVDAEGQLGQARDVLPEGELALEWVSRIGDRLVVGKLEGARRRLFVHALDGAAEREVELPDLSGNVWGMADRLDASVAHYAFSSIGDPAAVFRLDVESGEQRVVARPEGLTWDPADVVTEQVFYASADGTRVPMFLSYRRGLERDGGNHVLMYGYGAWKWAAYPWFNALRIVWIESGGVFAVPGLRGGGEYGAEWHDAGRRTNKPNTIADLVAAAEWLIEADVTRPGKLALQGGSASGMLPPAALNARPELFGAALVNWPRLDLIRYVEYEGKSVNIPEYGTPHDPNDFAVLRSYSPYHNVRDGARYPGVFVAAGTEDKTTLPCHAYKYVAAMQAAQAGDAPILLRVDWGGGHYPGTTERTIAIWADQLAFLFDRLDVEPAAALGTR